MKRVTYRELARISNTKLQAGSKAGTSCERKIDCCDKTTLTFIGAFIFLTTSSLKAQVDSLKTQHTFNPADSLTDKNSFFPLPLVYYKPETGLVYGVTSLYNFYLERKKPINPSQIQPGIGHSTLNQLLVYIHYQLFWNQNHNYAYGDMEYYRFSYNFFGVGNDSKADQYTAYRAHIIRLWANSMLKITPNIYAGGRLFFEQYNIGNRWHVRENFDHSTLPLKFQQENVPGAVTNKSLGLGGVLVADNRDNVYFPTSGYYAEVFLQHHSRLIGSTHTFTTVSSDLSYYKTFFKKTVFATNIYSVFNFGKEVPFNRMARLGGYRKLRGYYEGFLTDNHAVAVQAEMRQMLFWRIGIAAFANAGQVVNNTTNFSFSAFNYSYGTGLRIMFDKEKKVNLRFDYGLSNLGTRGFYISFNEAF